MGLSSEERRPTPRMKRLYRYLVDCYGETTNLFIFDGRELDHPVAVELIHVPTWAAEDADDITILTTLGMSEHQMPGADYRTELQLAYRGELAEAQRLDLARLLANMVEYPFDHNLKLDRWEILPNVGWLPVFTGCPHLLIHPPFSAEGTDWIQDPEGSVKMLYVVPITPHERHLLTVHGREVFVDYVADEAVDLLREREEAGGD